MKQTGLNLITALKNGEIVNVDDVESGLKCGCICPACRGTLVARHGQKRAHHFAHYVGQNCEYGYETSLHLAAKSILLQAKRIKIPAVYVNFPDSYKRDELVCESKEIEIEKVELEQHFDNVIPDVVIYSGGKQFFLEIYVTHGIDDEKLSKLRQLDISTIEVDLSKRKTVISTEELAELLLSDNEYKKWKYNSVANRYLQEFRNVSDWLELNIRGYAWHIDGCPINARMWHGKPYANFYDDCLGCKYCIQSFNNEVGVLCSGRRRISTIKDLHIPESERIKKADEMLAEYRDRKFAKGICPFCGQQIVERQGPYGFFVGCSAYPHCRFTASIDPRTGEIIMKD